MRILTQCTSQLYIWVDSDGKGGCKVPSGKGQRLILLHAGVVEGWVEGADFRPKTKLALLTTRMK